MARYINVTKSMEVRMQCVITERMFEFRKFASDLPLTSDFTFTFHFHALEKAMATHSRVLAWKIPGTEEPGGLPSMGSHRVGHD